MTTENKFKVIFAKRNKIFPIVAYTSEVPESDKYIEYAAVEQLKVELAYYKNGTQIKEVHYDEPALYTAEIAALKAENTNIKGDYTYIERICAVKSSQIDILMTEIKELNEDFVTREQYQALQILNNELNSEITALKSENENLYAAHNEWSRNDWRTFGALALENEQLKSKLKIVVEALRLESFKYASITNNPAQQALSEIGEVLK